jgi:hypothetical protein
MECASGHAAALPLTKQRIQNPFEGAAPYALLEHEEPSPPLLSTAAESCRNRLGRSGVGRGAA